MVQSWDQGATLREVVGFLHRFAPPLCHDKLVQEERLGFRNPDRKITQVNRYWVMKEQGKKGQRNGGDIEAMDICFRHVAPAGAMDKELNLEASPCVLAQTGLMIVEGKAPHGSECLVEIEGRTKRSLVQCEVDVECLQRVVNPERPLVYRESPTSDQEAALEEPPCSQCAQQGFHARGVHIRRFQGQLHRPRLPFCPSAFSRNLIRDR